MLDPELLDILVCPETHTPLRMAGDDLIVQTFVVSGTDSRGEKFRSHAVDLYPLRDGRVAAKRTFWKIDGLGPAV